MPLIETIIKQITTWPECIIYQENLQSRVINLWFSEYKPTTTCTRVVNLWLTHGLTLGLTELKISYIFLYNGQFSEFCTN